MADRDRLAQYWFGKDFVVVYGCFDETTPKEEYAWYEVVDVNGNILNKTPLLASVLKRVPEWVDCFHLFNDSRAASK